MTPNDAIAAAMPAPALRWARTPAAARPALVGFAVAIALHLLLALALALIDAWRATPATSTREIPVEVVEEPPKTETPLEEPPKPVESAPQADAPRPAQEARQSPESPARPQSAPQPPPLQQAQTANPPPSSRQAAAAAPPAAPAQPPPGSSDVEAPGLRAPPPAPAAAPTQKPPTRRADEPRAVTAEFALAPESFHRAAAPAADRETNDEYKGLVFERLERAKIVPPGLRANAIAVLSIMLDQAGNLVTATLLQSTGVAALDAEALALVRRAAPFPRPPPGVSLTFAPAIVFGVN